MKTTTIIPVVLLALFAIGAAVVLYNVGDGIIKKLFKGQRFTRKRAITTAIALVLTAGTFASTIALWPSPVADEPLTNAEGGHSFTAEIPDIPMSGDRTNAQLDEFLKEGFGENYEAVWNGNDADEFMFKNDQDKILANEAYLQSLGLKDTGFRNGVCFPTEVLTAEVIRNLPNMTDEERAEVFNQHRWLDIYWKIMTIPGYCDMVVQDLEEYPEYVEQNSRWLPALKELLAEAKASPDGMYSLLVKEDDGSEHYSDAYRYGAAKVCASLENAIIRGVSMDTESVMNWELPSFSPEIQDRWTVKLTEKEDQENKPASIWAFPNVKSGNDAYVDGFNLADRRVEKFAPETTVVKIDNPDPGTTPTTPTHKVWSHHVVKGTNAELSDSPIYQTIAEGQDWQTSRRTYAGYDYNSCSHRISSNGVVTGVMGTEDIHVYFYYTPKQGTPDPVYVSLTVQHIDAHSGTIIEQEGPTSYVQGARQDVSKKSFGGYAYAGYYTVNGGSNVYGTGTTLTLNADTTVKFYYDREQTLTTKHVDIDTGVEVHTPDYDYYVGGSQFTASAYDIPGYERVSNSETSGNPKTVTGTMPFADKTVTFYYKKVVANQTVTAYYRAIDSNHNIIDPIVQTKPVGSSYTTVQKEFAGYRFHHVVGNTSGTVGNQPIEVTYWYELIQQDGNNNKNTEADPTKNGTGNANPVKGPDNTTDLDKWQPGNPDDGTRVPPQQGDEPTSNHLPTDNQGGQAAGSDERQEVGSETVSGIVGDGQETGSSGTGGHDPGHVDTGATEVEGGGYTPPPKTEIVPDNPPSGNDPVIGAGSELGEP